MPLSLITFPVQIVIGAVTMKLAILPLARVSALPLIINFDPNSIAMTDAFYCLANIGRFNPFWVVIHKYYWHTVYGSDHFPFAVLVWVYLILIRLINLLLTKFQKLHVAYFLEQVELDLGHYLPSWFCLHRHLFCPNQAHLIHGPPQPEQSRKHLTIIHIFTALQILKAYTFADRRIIIWAWLFSSFVFLS